MKRSRFARVLSIVVLAAMLMLAVVSPALAMDLREGDTVVIGASEVIDDDLYVGANTFTLDGTVKGDVVAGGQTITINGTVEGSLLAVGQTIIINGVVKNTVRVAGASITLGERAQIEGDLLVGGYSLETKAGSAVGRDLSFGGSQALVAGDVTRRAWLAGNGFELQGAIGGDARVYLSDTQSVEGLYPSSFIPEMPAAPIVQNGLRLAPGAKIGGNLDYTAIAAIPETSAVAGQVTRHEPAPKSSGQGWDSDRATPVSAGAAALIWLWARARRLIALFLVGLLLAFVFPKWTRRLMDNVQLQPLPSLGWGCVMLVAVFAAWLAIAIATVVLALALGVVTLGGLMGTVVGLGVLASLALCVAFGLAVYYVAPIVVSYLLGRLIFGKANLSPTIETLLALVVGLLIYVLVTAIPCVGWLIAFIVVLFGLGALLIWARGLIEKRTVA